MINANTIPEELREVPQWVCWKTKERDGKQTKVPVNPQTEVFASVRDSRTWASFEEAVETATETDSVAGVGFVFTEDDPFVGVDLDDCRDEESGKPAPWARALIEQLDSFSEVSPSGTGFHVYVRGELPDGGNRSGNIECYEAARFFTVTGEWVAGTPTEVHERTAALEAMHSEHIAASAPPTASPTSAPTTMADEELLSKAMNAKNGEKFTRLWNGNTSGYDSHSEADMALCFLLAFWTGRDTAQMDRLFRRSGLYREKWDDRHYGDGRTYGEGTIERAVRETTDVYEPPTTERADISGDPPETVSASTDSNRREPVASEVVDTVAELTTAVAELRRSFETLEAQHEYLYEELQSERQTRDQALARIKELETAVSSQEESWLQRLF